jgi:hypothetical protein
MTRPVKGVVAVLFRKRQKYPPYVDSSETPERQQFFQIDLEMMLKGSFCKRHKKTVRQFGVTVNGATRLVTSGDMVDRETYEALRAAGAIRSDIPGPLDADHEAPGLSPGSPQ